MDKGQSTKRQTMLHKTLPKKRKIGQHEGRRVNTDTPEVKTVTVSKALCEHGPF